MWECLATLQRMTPCQADTPACPSARCCNPAPSSHLAAPHDPMYLQVPHRSLWDQSLTRSRLHTSLPTTKHPACLLRVSCSLHWTRSSALLQTGTGPMTLPLASPAAVLTCSPRCRCHRRSSSRHLAARNLPSGGSLARGRGRMGRRQTWASV